MRKRYSWRRKRYSWSDIVEMSQNKEMIFAGEDERGLTQIYEGLCSVYATISPLRLPSRVIVNSLIEECYARLDALRKVNYERVMKECYARLDTRSRNNKVAGKHKHKPSNKK